MLLSSVQNLEGMELEKLVAINWFDKKRSNHLIGKTLKSFIAIIAHIDQLILGFYQFFFSQI